MDPQNDSKTNLKTWRYMLWGLIGATLIGLHVYLTLLSAAFAPDATVDEPSLLHGALLLVAGAVYLIAVLLLYRQRGSHAGLLRWILLTGLAMRALTFFSEPILEDDWYRYLWDGAVLAQGYNPYAWAPNEVEYASLHDVPETIQALAEDGGPVFDNINHPWLRTIYPPVAQAAFALSYYLAPFNLSAWRLILMLSDVLTLALLLLLLRELKMSPLWIAVYWLCPLVVKEVYNTVHVDAIMMPMLLGALYLSMRGRLFIAMLVLALAVGVKIWPIILLPIFLRPYLKQPRQLIGAAALFGLIALAFFIPVYVSGLDSESGFTAYARKWEMNDALFMLFYWGAEWLWQGIDDTSLQKSLIQWSSRAVAGAIVMLCVLALAWRPSKDPKSLCEKCLLAAAALFLVSPTQFPWYYLWVMPFLVLRPRPSLILLAALLPMYYLRFHYKSIGQVNLFDHGIVWIEYAPVWILLIGEFVWDYIRRRNNKAEVLSSDA